jgi:multiple sugar transport system permease protein
MDLGRYFTKIVVCTYGGPAASTKVMGFRIFEEGLRFFKFGYASTIGFPFLLFAIVIGIIFVQLYYSFRK